MQKCFHIRGHAVACSPAQARANSVDTILLKWLGFKTLFTVLFFEQILESIYLFDAREVFLTLQILTKEDRQITGLQKGVLTAAARVGGQWQMRGHTRDKFCKSFIRVGCGIGFQNPLVGSALAVGFLKKKTLLVISKSVWATKTGLTSPNFEAAASLKTRHILPEFNYTGW